MKSTQSWARFFAGLFVMIFGTLAVISRPDPSRWVGRDSTSILPRLAATVPPQGAQLVRTEPAPALRLITEYAHCGHRISQTQPGSADADRLAAQYPGWTVTATGEGFVLTRQVNQLCPDHILARLEGDTLCLYRNALGGDTLMLDQSLPNPLTQVHAASLEQELAAGVVFHSREALEAYLESLES